MFIKNYSDTDLVIKYKGNEYTLTANDVSYVDESWISLALIKAMFGDYVEELNPDIPIEEFLFDNQVEVSLDTVYLTRAVGPGTSRVFIKDAKADIYFSDGKDIPTSKSDMSLFTDYTNVDGLLVMEVMPKWTLFTAHSSGNPQVILTNIEAIEQQ